MNAKIIEQGNGFRGVVVGANLWDASADELVTVVSLSTRIQTDDSRGNYMLAEIVRADMDVTSLTDGQFAALPAVKVARVEA